jgi:aspartate 4-decarboxylase
MPGADFLSAMTSFAVKKFGFDRDAFVHELVDSIIGDNYPVPDRMLVHNERIVQEYLQWAMCGEPRPSGKFDLYAVEGGTAAMCYLFKSVKANRLLHPGDTIALGTPIFTPYLEMTHLEDYDLKVVHIRAPQENRFQYTDEEIKKLEDPNIKAFFIVNPGNPTGMAIDKETIGRITKLVKTKRRPDVADGRRLRHLRRQFPFAARRIATEHHRRLFLLKRISAAPAGGSASSRFTRTTSSTR